jgi:hypothetical protein
VDLVPVIVVSSVRDTTEEVSSLPHLMIKNSIFLNVVFPSFQNARRWTEHKIQIILKKDESFEDYMLPPVSNNPFISVYCHKVLICNSKEASFLYRLRP